MGRNECAQRAAAAILHVPAEMLARTHPPDTPLRLLGTTPTQLARMFTDHGRASRVILRATPSDLERDAIACVDLRPLRGGLPRLHWLRIDNVDEHGVRAEGRHHAWARFMRAWNCRASPFRAHRRALVVPDATPTRRTSSD